MTDRIWLPPEARVERESELEVTPEGYVQRKIDRANPQAYRIKPKDLQLAMARMSRDGMTREAIRKALDIPHVGPLAVDDATFDRALAVARAVLEEEIRAGREPEETVTTELVPDDGEDD